MPPKRVDFYLDFISPYAWLALNVAGEFARRNEITWALHPVVYGVLLSANELVGPAEVPVKRRYTFLDVARSAQHLGLRFTGPPSHPFLSLAALRTQWLHRQSDRTFDLAVALSNATWSEGRDLTDVSVLSDVVSSIGLDSSGLADRIRAPAVKQGLKAETAAAVARGVFGVPSFVFDDEVFWGSDRMEALEHRLNGERFEFSAECEAMLARPMGIDRRNKNGQAPTG